MNTRPHTHFCVPIFVRTRVSMHAHINTSNKRRTHKQHECVSSAAAFMYKNTTKTTLSFPQNGSGTPTIPFNETFPFLVPGLLAFKMKRGINVIILPCVLDGRDCMELPVCSACWSVTRPHVTLFHCLSRVLDFSGAQLCLPHTRL